MKKRIYFVVADITFKGGIERVTVNLANELIKENDITIVSYFKTNKKINYELNEKIKVEYLSNEKYDGEPGSFKRLFKFLKSLYIVTKYFKEDESDVIIAQGMPVALMLFFLNFMNKKIIVCEHVHYFYYGKFIRFIRSILYKFYFKVIVLTKKDKEYFQKNLKNVECIPNFTSYISDKTSQLNNKVLISVGRLEEQKGYDILINICSKFLSKYPEWKLKIFGEGNLKEKLQNQIEKSNLKNQVLLMGTTDRIEQEYLNSDIYIMSSRFEGFPMVLLEATSYSLPIISFDCPSGPSDIVEDGINGFLIRNFNEKEMLEKIEILMNDEKLRKEMSKNCKEKIEKFSKEKILEKWRKILKNNILNEDDKN